MNVTSSGKRDLADMIKGFAVERLHWTMGVDPNCNPHCPYKNGNRGGLDIRGGEGNVVAETD